MTTQAESRTRGGEATKQQRSGTKRGGGFYKPVELTPHQKRMRWYGKAIYALWDAWHDVDVERYRTEIAALDAALAAEDGFEGYAQQVIARFGA